MSLASKLSLVTGAGSGIGRAVCQVFAREGASVAVAGNILSDIKETARGLEDVARSHGHTDAQFIPLEVDVSSSVQVQSLFGSLTSSFARGAPLSVVVNAAGIMRDALLLQQTEEDFDRVVDVNLKGTFLVTQGAVKLMREGPRQDKSIVNFSSIAGKCGMVAHTNYCASKGGVMSLTLACAKELGRHGIRCNALLPGLIETPMTATVPQKMMENLGDLIPLGRVGKPEEVAELCAFLASEKSSYVSGALIEITGGLNSS